MADLLLLLLYNDEIVRQRGRVGSMRRCYHASVDGQRRRPAKVERAGAAGAVAGDVTASRTAAQIQRRLRIVHRRNGKGRRGRRTTGRRRRTGQPVTAAATAAAFGREINREGRDGMVLLVDAATADDAIATATIGRYHNERWCCGMSVYEGFVWNDRARGGECRLKKKCVA